MTAALPILYEDNHCLAVDKPAGRLVQADATGDATLLDDAKAYIQEKYGKPGNVYLASLHRLDRPVSGAVLFARTSKAAKRLADAFRRGAVEKRYLALVAGAPASRTGQCVDWLRKDEAANRVHVTEPGAPGAKEARLRYEVWGDAAGGRAWLAVWLQTGRPHQIRVQLARLGCPVVGDLRYGHGRGLKLGHWIALHAWRLTFPHPTRQEPVTVTAPVPAAWKSFGRAPMHPPAAL